ncbi:MAG: S1/P1 nuclease [Rhodomicrobium sp.]
MTAARTAKHIWLLPILPFALQFIAAPEALAWGDTGHRIVCQLAYIELNPAAKAKVDALIALDPKYRSFASSCTWPDAFPPQRPAEHFLNVPRGAHAIDPAKLCPVSDRCVASAILNDTRDLALAQDPMDRLRLLKSLGHWVGDIHQPLHVSFQDDKGANYIGASGQCSYSLHLAWDICIVESKIGTGEVAVAAALQREITEADRKAWMPAGLDAGAVASWASESLAIAERPPVQYCYWHDDACWYSQSGQQFTGQRRTVEITAQYLEEEAPVVRERLKQAGIRLAAILNAVLAD